MSSKKLFKNNQAKNKLPYENQTVLGQSLKKIFLKPLDKAFEKNDNDKIFINSQNAFLKPLNHVSKTSEQQDKVFEVVNVNEEENDRNDLPLLNPSSVSESTSIIYKYEYENVTGEIYMRVGLAIFTLCALISHIIHLVQMLEAFLNNKSDTFTCKFTFITTVISKVSSVVFILVQSAFVLKYANIVLHSAKSCFVIGLMHIVCTNFCLFVRTVIFETAAEIRNELENGVEEESSYENFDNRSINSVYKRNVATSDSTQIHYEQFNNLGCINVSITDRSKRIQQTQNYLAEFLFPIVIEYSLLGMTIFYVLLSNFKSSKNLNKNQKHTYEGLNQFSIDCTKSTTG